MPDTRYASAIELPPYGYIPGHGLPHPVNDPAGHLHATCDAVHAPPLAASMLAALPTDAASRQRALAAMLTANPRWRYAIDLFNGGFYWEAHEAWEGFWQALGRTTPEARFVQGLIHLAAACVKIREGKPAGVARHTRRARELLGDPGAADSNSHLGLAPDSLAAVVAELAGHTAACWHTTRAPVVRVVAGDLRMVG